jgi:Transcriptional regulatory protein, C terminal
MTCYVAHAGKVLTHKFLLRELWDDLTDAQYLRVYVRQLRQKIESDPERPQYILTETGIGYRKPKPGFRHLQKERLIGRILRSLSEPNALTCVPAIIVSRGHAALSPSFGCYQRF